MSLSAVVVSFSLMVAMAIMVFSFRTSLDQWMQRILPADVYVRAGPPGSQASYIPPQVLARLATLPGVTTVEGSRYAEASLAPGREPVTLIARPIDAERAQRTLWLERSAQRPVPAGAVPVWISQAAADLFALQPDATLQLAIANRLVTASVRGVWRDYQYLRGAVIIDRDTYVRLSGDERINSISLWLAPGTSIAALQAAARTVLPENAGYELRTPVELRAASLRVFDRAFAVTYLLEGVAVLIGLLGISASASAQALARRGEFGVLRHLGFTRGQIAVTLAVEGAGAGFAGVCAGLLSGGVLSLILIRVINRQSFHWDMDLVVPVGLLIALSVTLIALSSMVAVLSGRQAMSGDALRAVKADW
jgi:putative ABC transport system permease protein